MPYDDDALPDGEDEVLPWPLELSCHELKKLALYCVEDGNHFPWIDLLKDLGLPDPGSILMPSWQLKERRVWMSTGGAQGCSSVSAGFHWDHMQNIHVVLSGSKEVFLVPPLLAPALHSTRFCMQAQWHLSRRHGRMSLEKVAMQSEESSTDYALISIDNSFEENLQRHPRMAEEMKEPPFRVLLQPGDAIYIPPGWWHSIRTFRPERDPHQNEKEELPFAFSMNFWYDAPEQKASYAPTLLTLEILSRQRAMTKSPEDHLSDLLKQMDGDQRFELVD
eukprot:symbB.v1.2.002914.t1/scaffold160.1/size429097/5